jgi:hypothetical protein
LIFSVILEILSVICYNTQLFCKIPQPFSRFHPSFSRMTDAGVGAQGGWWLGQGCVIGRAWLGRLIRPLGSIDETLIYHPM